MEDEEVDEGEAVRGKRRRKRRKRRKRRRDEWVEQEMLVLDRWTIPRDVHIPARSRFNRGFNHQKPH